MRLPRSLSQARSLRIRDRLAGPSFLRFRDPASEGRTGVYGTWHPPVMSWLLGLGDALLPGTGLFVLFDIVLAFGALLSLMRFGSGGRHGPPPPWRAFACSRPSFSSIKASSGRTCCSPTLRWRVSCAWRKLRNCWSALRARGSRSSCSHSFSSCWPLLLARTASWWDSSAASALGWIAAKHAEGSAAGAVRLSMAEAHCSARSVLGACANMRIECAQRSRRVGPSCSDEAPAELRHRGNGGGPSGIGADETRRHRTRACGGHPHRWRAALYAAAKRYAGLVGPAPDRARQFRSERGPRPMDRSRSPPSLALSENARIGVSNGWRSHPRSGAACRSLLASAVRRT